MDASIPRTSATALPVAPRLRGCIRNKPRQSTQELDREPIRASAIVPQTTQVEARPSNPKKKRLGIDKSAPTRGWKGGKAALPPSQGWEATTAVKPGEAGE